MQKTSPMILVVEDDEEIREDLSELLREQGYDVLCAENGEVALSILRSHKNVQAIVLDVAMPVMNGATFRGQQLADPDLAPIPLILLTGRDDIRPMATALGAAASLSKPFEPEALLAVIERHLR